MEKFDVTGMTCAACSAHVERAVRGVEGVKEVTVSLLTNSMTVDFSSPPLPRKYAQLYLRRVMAHRRRIRAAKKKTKRHCLKATSRKKYSIGS